MIHVVCTIDENYIQHCAVMLSSIFYNTTSDDIFIHIIYDGPDNRERKKLQRFLANLTTHFHFYKIDARALENAHLSHHITLATYFRVLIPEIVSKKIEKVIFLDADLVLRKNIKELWATDIEGYYVAAVENPVSDREILRERLNIPVEYSYFNAGVLVMNLKKWREDNLSARIIDYINNNSNKLLWWDQDALNANIYNCWKKIPLKWNVHHSLFQLTSFKDEGISEIELSENIKDPAIIHYSSKFKPWHYWCDHPLKNEYFFYLQKTPWRNFRIKEDTGWHRLKQKAKGTINKLVGRNIFRLYA